MPDSKAKYRIASMYIVLLLLPVMAGAQSSSKTGFHLKEADRVVFYGDSITDQRLYTAFVETYVVTRFPTMKVRFINSGWGGDRVTGGGGGPVDIRLSRDVIAHKPTVLTIMLGMNDGGVRAFDADLFNTYSKGYRHIVAAVKQALPRIRITLIQPSPYDDVTRPPLFEGGYNAVLIRYGQFVKELAERESLTVADLNAPLVAATEKAMVIDKQLATRLNPDRVHPPAGGQLIMAQALLEAWNAPATVSAVEIDAAAKRIMRAENTLVSALKSGDQVSWTQGDKALPMPLDLTDPVVSLAARCSGFLAALDQEVLKVTGLTAQRYGLKIDGEEVGTFTRDELSAGINLAALTTPMTKQAANVHALTVKRGEVYWIRWRQIQFGLQNFSLPEKQTVLDALDKLEGVLYDQQRATAQPKQRRYELDPQQD